MQRYVPRWLLKLVFGLIVVAFGVDYLVQENLILGVIGVAAGGSFVLESVRDRSSTRA